MVMWWPCVEVERREKRGSSAGNYGARKMVEGTAVGWSGYRCDACWLWWCVDNKTEKEKEKREERAWQGKCALKSEQA